MRNHLGTIERFSVAATLALPGLFFAAESSADIFFWQSNGNPNASQWSNHLNWSGPTGQYPHLNTADVYVSGQTVYDPIWDTNGQLGSLTVQLGGSMSTGTGSSNYLLVVTAVGGKSGLTLIKDPLSFLTVYRSSNMNDLDSDDLLIRSGARLRLRDGAKVQVDDFLDLNTGAELEGEGSVEFTRNDGTNNPDNDGLIRANGGTLRFFGHADTVFDLDGPGENGALQANANSTLIFDVGVESIFNGTMTIGNNAEIQIDDAWSLSSEPGSVLSFNGGLGSNRAELSGTGTVTWQGTVNVNSGDARVSSISVGSQADVTLAAGTTLEVLEFMFLDTGSPFLGTGQLRLGSGSLVEMESGATIGVPVYADGQIVIGGSSAGSATISSFQMGPNAQCDFGLCDPIGSFDQLTVNGAAILDGRLDLAGLFACEPDAGDEFVIITAGSITGEFAEVTGLPNVEIVYSPTTVTAVVSSACAADLDDSGIVDVGDLLALLAAWGTPNGDIDDDGTTNVTDLLALLAAWGACM